MNPITVCDLIYRVYDQYLGNCLRDEYFVQKTINSSIRTEKIEDNYILQSEQLMIFTGNLKKTHFKKSIRYKLISIILLFKSFKNENAIILVSYPRSGSTWLAEILGQLSRTIINWEPLHSKSGIVPKALLFGEMPYIPENSLDKTYYRLFKNIFKNSVYSKHTSWYLGIKQLIYSKQVVVKFCRANLLLPWFVTRFKFRYKPIFLIRHPIPTCLSIIKSWVADENTLLCFDKAP